MTKTVTIATDLFDRVVSSKKANISLLHVTDRQTIFGVLDDNFDDASRDHINYLNLQGRRRSLSKYHTYSIGHGFRFSHAYLGDDYVGSFISHIDQHIVVVPISEKNSADCDTDRGGCMSDFFPKFRLVVSNNIGIE